MLLASRPETMKLTVPTWLTLLRIVMIPVLVVVFYLPYKWTNFAAATVFGLAAITDWLDGWVARRYHQYSAFGAFLDPVADKLMVAVALFLIVQGHPTPWMAFWAAVIVGREIAVSALREWMAEIGQRAKVRVAMVGKIKTTAQMVALLCLLYSVTSGQADTHEIWMGNLTFQVGYWMLAVAALLTLWSGFQYLHAAWPSLREDEKAAVQKNPKKGRIPRSQAGIAQLVERNLAKVEVASSSLVSRSNFDCKHHRMFAFNMKSAASASWDFVFQRGNSSVGRAQPCQG
jgi:CDP-diacylglycerol--glycerol-3-phosphate 3-phosphatidyltransferase